jgi:hypothetical protein
LCARIEQFHVERAHERRGVERRSAGRREVARHALDDAGERAPQGRGVHGLAAGQEAARPADGQVEGERIATRRSPDRVHRRAVPVAEPPAHKLVDVRVGQVAETVLDLPVGEARPRIGAARTPPPS